MSKIRSRNTKPEVRMQVLLNDLGYETVLHSKEIFGTPDIFLPLNNLVIQVNGCFWHGHKNCRYFVVPKSNIDFWVKKINSNIRRDKKVNAELKKASLKTCTIWECEIRNGRFLDKLLKYL